MLSEKEKAERYDLVVGYFQKILQDREDSKFEEMICYDEDKKPRYKDEVERQEEVADEFIYDLDNIGFNDFAELMLHEVYGERVSLNNQFYDHVYGA